MQHVIAHLIISVLAENFISFLKGLLFKAAEAVTILKTDPGSYV